MYHLLEVHILSQCHIPYWSWCCLRWIPKLSPQMFSWILYLSKCFLFHHGMAHELQLGSSNKTKCMVLNKILVMHILTRNIKKWNVIITMHCTLHAIYKKNKTYSLLYCKCRDKNWFINIQSKVQNSILIANILKELFTYFKSLLLIYKYSNF
jgi:hypothetical protein